SSSGERPAVERGAPKRSSPGIRERSQRAARSAAGWVSARSAAWRTAPTRFRSRGSGIFGRLTLTREAKRLRDPHQRLLPVPAVHLLDPAEAAPRPARLLAVVRDRDVPEDG